MWYNNDDDSSRVLIMISFKKSFLFIISEKLDEWSHWIKLWCHQGWLHICPYWLWCKGKLFDECTVTVIRLDHIYSTMIICDTRHQRHTGPFQTKEAKIVWYLGSYIIATVTKSIDNCYHSLQPAWQAFPWGVCPFRFLTAWKLGREQKLRGWREGRERQESSFHCNACYSLLTVAFSLWRKNINLNLDQICKWSFEFNWSSTSYESIDRRDGSSCLIPCTNNIIYYCYDSIHLSQM